MYDRVLEIDPTTPERERLRILHAMMREGAEDGRVRRLSERIAHQALADGRAGVVARVQSLLDWTNRTIRYREDPAEPDGWIKECFQPATTTLDRGAGDCEDMVVLVGALSMASGVVAIPVWITQPESKNNHVAGKVCVPYAAAGGLGREGNYRVEVIEPPDKPICPGRWLWYEATLRDVVAAGRAVRGALVGEHPYDVLARYRAAGLVRLGL